MGQLFRKKKLSYLVKSLTGILLNYFSPEMNTPLPAFIREDVENHKYSLRFQEPLA